MQIFSMEGDLRCLHYVSGYVKKGNPSVNFLILFVTKHRKDAMYIRNITFKSELVIHYAPRWEN